MASETGSKAWGGCHLGCLREEGHQGLLRRIDAKFHQDGSEEHLSLPSYDQSSTLFRVETCRYWESKNFKAPCRLLDCTLWIDNHLPNRKSQSLFYDRGLIKERSGKEITCRKSRIRRAYEGTIQRFHSTTHKAECCLGQLSTSWSACEKDYQKLNAYPW